MATVVCDEQSNNLAVDELYFGPYASLLAFTGFSGAEAFFSIPADLFAAGVLTDQATPEYYTPMFDTGVLTDVLTPTNRALIDALEVPGATEQLSLAFRADNTDVGVFADIVSENGLILLADFGTLGDTLTPQTTGGRNLFDTLFATDELLDAKTALLADTGAFTDTLLDTRTAVAFLTDAGVATDELFAAALRWLDVADSGRFTAVLSSVTTSQPVLQEEGFFEDFLILPYTDGWTANTDTMAASRYELPQLTGLASAFDKEVYAAGPQGVYRFSGATDAGNAISAFAEGQLNDLGSEQLKLARSLYLGYTSERPLTVRMTITYDGEETAYDYELPERVANNWVPGRFKLGRGLRSRYMRYRISNTDGGDFSIDSAVLDVDVSTRRV